MKTIFTVGHSNHAPDAFLSLLKLHKINAIADVRSAPYSRFTPQYNKEALSALLDNHGITYVFLGNYLGARPNDPLCYKNGKVDFARLCLTDYFQEGLQRVRKGADRFKLSLLCSEKDPIQCHRMVLVCRHLRQADLSITHILEDGRLEENHDSERRLMDTLNIDSSDLFKTINDLIEEAYNRQGERIAYHEDQDGGRL